jgi:outer membrane immunogenic protein
MRVKGLVGVTLLLAGPAFAADLDTRAPVKATPVKAPPASVYSWTGFYIGGNLGGVFNSASGTSDFLDTLNPGRSNPRQDSPSQRGILGGVQAGYNWQFSQWGVLGLEGDWDWGGRRYSFCHSTTIT